VHRPTDLLWIRWLEVVLLLVMAYSLVLVVDGGLALRLFDALGFGPDAADDAFRDYLRLPFAVLGAVMVGWMALLFAVVHGPLRRREPWAWPAVVLSLAAWFVLDTGMSMVLGFPTHALFNLVFAVALAVPLIGLRRSRSTPVAS
jgi:uncharacterized BrkB/YihY/UPF0761 family membrane protein